MRDKDISKVDAAVESLNDRLNQGLLNIAFMNSIADNNQVPEKINGSYSGFAMSASINAVEISLLLFVTRCWDINGHTIPFVLSKISNEAETIANRRRNDLPDWPENVLSTHNIHEKLSSVLSRSKKFQDEPDYLRARLLRTETFAHSLPSSDIRKAHSEVFALSDDLTGRRITELAFETADITREIIHLWKFHVWDISQTINLFEKHCRLFWTTLPVLSEAEKQTTTPYDTA